MSSTTEVHSVWPSIPSSEPPARHQVGILDDLCVAEDHRLLQAYIDHTEGESFFMRILPLLSKGSASASSWLSELQNVGTTAPSAVHVALSPGKSSRNAVLFTTPENPARTSRTSSGGSNPGVVASSQPRMIFQDGEHLNQVPAARNGAPPVGI